MDSSIHYQIIPRRFRPKRFSEVVGHQAIVTTLKNALTHQKMGQAYLFCGTRGCGKTTLARLFAKALNCTQLEEQREPCNGCTSCLEISEGRSLDIIEIDGASNRGIDDVRKLTETVGYAPQTGRYKIYIIDEVHMLTKEAFNALLKTLEEPPERVKFFFATTEPHRIPPTIISRCQRFNLARIPAETIVQKLKKIAKQIDIEIEAGALEQIGQIAEGSLRDAESLLDQLICFAAAPITEAVARDLFGLISHDHLDKIDDAIEAGDIDQAIAIGKSLYHSGRDMGACIDHLLEHYRDHLLSPRRFDRAQCLSILETLIQWQQQLAKTPFKQVHLEMCLAALVKSARRISLDSLIQRLLTLEAASSDKSPAQPSPGSKKTQSSSQQQSSLRPATQSQQTQENRGPEALESTQPAPRPAELPAAAELKPNQPSVPESKKTQSSSQQQSSLRPATQPQQTQENRGPEALESIQPAAPSAAISQQEEKSDTKKSQPPSTAAVVTEEHPASKYETLIRFAAVELEGSIKNG